MAYLSSLMNPDQTAMNKLLLVLISLFFVSGISAQSVKDSETGNITQAHSFGKMKLSYLSDNIYNGRKDSLPVPYITPSAAWHHKSGLYARTSASFLVSNYAQRLDLFNIEGGYEYEIGDHFNGSISANKPFYNSASVSVRSETKAEFNADFTWDIKSLFTLNGGVGYMLTSGPADVYFNSGLSHEFTFGEDDQWSIEPSFNANFGTRYYYDQYKQKRLVKTGKKKRVADSSVIVNGNEKIVTTTTVTTVNPQKLVLLDNEWAVSFYYYTGSWSFYAIPTVTIPLNPAEYVTTVKTRTTFSNGSSTHNIRQTNSSETITNHFFIEIGIGLRL